MPVTIQVAKHEARPVSYALQSGIPAERDSQNVLEKLASKNSSDIGKILHTGLGPQTSLSDARLQDLRLSVQDHGLVRAAYYAYSDHHHLVLRPEDVWFAILTQFSFFVNAHSEELRSSFVAHEGKKGLVLRDPGQPDMGIMCRNMTKLIDENIVDAELRKWVLPAFTTTTVNDEVIAAIIMMGTLQKYFDYVFDCSCCGIPTVTLLGELSDWADIQRRIEKLSEYGEEPTRFCGMLRPILKYMVASFTDGPDNAAVVDFWSRIIDRQGDSGTDTLTGWMVAFCFWDEDGREVIDTKLLAGFVGFEAIIALNHPWRPPAETRQPGEDAPFYKKPHRGVKSLLRSASRTLSKLCNNGVSLDDTQEKVTTSQEGPTQTQKAEGSSRPLSTPKYQLDTLQPVTGWWMYRVRQGESTGMSREDFLQSKLENDWNGQVSTGYVQQDGETVLVEEGLPSY
ncbi:hypothetical protein GQ53DRAFT_808631 [Thozetella sp. PMI_491]|nr:hypothetical protein GQ53DRAFT_808631 [Thozetella sp. PMI_491]